MLGVITKVDAGAVAIFIKVVSQGNALIGTAHIIDVALDRALPIIADRVAVGGGLAGGLAIATELRTFL